MRKNAVLYYLHSDHPSASSGQAWGTALVTKSDGSVQSEQGYYAYGPGAQWARTSGTLPTDHKFTGQKLDDSGLYYYNARYGW